MGVKPMKRYFTYPLKDFGFVNLLFLFGILFVLFCLMIVIEKISPYAGAYLSLPIYLIVFSLLIYSLDYLNQIAQNILISDDYKAPQWRIDDIHFVVIIRKSLIIVISILEVFAIIGLYYLITKTIGININHLVIKWLISILFFEFYIFNFICYNIFNTFNLFRFFTLPDKLLILKIIIINLIFGIFTLIIPNYLFSNIFTRAIIITLIFYFLQTYVFYMVISIKQMYEEN